MSDLLRIIDYFTVCWRIDSHFSLSQEECFTKKSYLYISRGWNTGWQTEAQFIFDYMQVNCVWYVFSCSNCDNLHDNINFFFFVYCLWNHSYKNSSKKYSFKREVSLFASMLTSMKSNLLNSRFITLEAHEGKSVEVKAGTSLFQNLSLSHKLLTQCTNIPRTAQKVQVSWSSLPQTLFWEVGGVNTIFDYVSSCVDGFSLNFCSLESP